MSNKRLNLKNDIIFKTFFARKGNEQYLIDFLNALLNIEIRTIKIREEVSLQRLSTTEKGGRLDLQAVVNNDIIANIEMQVKNNGDTKQRTTFYGSKVLSQETEIGIKYEDMNQIIMINILNYEMLPFNECVSKTAIVLDKHRNYEVLDGIQWYFIELPKFRKSNPDMAEKLNQWLAFIDDYDEEMIELAEQNNQTIRKAKIELGTLTGDAEVRRLAELQEKWERDYNSGMSYARKEGKKEGKKEGEKQKAIEVAKKLLKINMPIEQIIEITEISEEEIKKIEIEIE